jgi:rhodanese-related sulfurtransferase/DNA-binding transcriptional ArsR family regulator
LERLLKDELYFEIARVGKSLSSPKRLEILDLLMQGPKSVEALSKGTNMSVANVSQHLQTLLEARLVRYSKKGNYVIYELSDTSVADFMISLHRLSESQLYEIKRIKMELMNQHENMEAVTLDELTKRMEMGKILLIDVRPAEEYDTEHIPEAISIPIEELEKHLSSLPSNIDIVAYCRGPYCLMSSQAVELMNHKGFRAFRLEEGVHEWRQFAGQQN